MAWAVVAMTVMIVAVDQLLWRPLVVWSQRFRVEEIGSGEPPHRGSSRSSGGRASCGGFALAPSGAHGRRRARGRRRCGARRPPGRAPPGPVSCGLRRPPRPRVLRPRPLSGARCASSASSSASRRASGASSASRSGRPASGRPGRLALAVLWTVPVGILLGRSPAWSRRLQPVVQIVASFPAPMLYPLVTAPSSSRVPLRGVAAVLMVLGAQWYVLFNVLAGASAMPGDLGEAADVYGLSGFRRFRTLDLRPFSRSSSPGSSRPPGARGTLPSSPRRSSSAGRSSRPSGSALSSRAPRTTETSRSWPPESSRCRSPSSS